MGFGKEKPYSLLPSIDVAAADCDWFTSTEETSLSVWLKNYFLARGEVQAYRK